MKRLIRIFKFLALKYLWVKPINLRGPSAKGYVSFTFDDFPHTAAQKGREILNRFGVKGTFYVSLGLENKVCYGKVMNSPQELDQVYEDGHEVGCHTYFHTDCKETQKWEIKESMEKNIEELERRLPGLSICSFAYPKGRPKLSAKALTDKFYKSSRTAKVGVNYNGGDQNMLKANSIYSKSFAFENYKLLIDTAVAKNGWLIFYTHDVEESPSNFGCKPEELSRIVEYAVTSGAVVLPVGNVVQCRSRFLER